MSGWRMLPWTAKQGCHFRCVRQTASLTFEEIESRVAVAVADRRSRAFRYQEFNKFKLGSSCRAHQRGVTVVVLGVRIRSEIQQVTGNMILSPRASSLERRAAIATVSIRFGFVGNQQLHEFDVPHECRHFQRGATVLILSRETVDTGAAFQERRNRAVVVALDCADQSIALKGGRRASGKWSQCCEDYGSRQNNQG